MNRCQLVLSGSILGLCAATAVAQVQEPSLADVARQHAVKKAKMVVSNEDSPAPPQAKQVTAEAAATDGPPPAAENTPTAPPSSSEAVAGSTSDTPAQAEARQRVQEQQKEMEFLNRNIKDAEAKLALAGDEAHRQAFADMIANYKNQLPQAQQELADAQNDLEKANQAATRLRQ